MAFIIGNLCGVPSCHSSMLTFMAFLIGDLLGNPRVVPRVSPCYSSNPHLVNPFGSNPYFQDEEVS